MQLEQNFQTIMMNETSTFSLSAGPINESTTESWLSSATTDPGSVSVDDGPIFLVSEETYNDFNFILNVFITPIMCGLCTVGNCLSVGVLWRDSVREKLTIYTYLCSLTLLDTVYLFFGFVKSTPKIMAVFDKYLANVIDEYSKLASIYVDMILTYTSTLVILVMAVERLMALVRPFHMKTSILAKYPKQIVGCCFFANVLFFIPYPLNFTIGEAVNAEGRTEYFIMYKPDAVELMETFTFVHTIIHNYIPGVVILCVNVAIPIAFSRVVQRRTSTLQQASRSQANQQRKITLIVVCITVMHFLCNFPDLFIKTLGFIDRRYSFAGEYKLTFWLFMDLVDLFTYLSAANDFLIYVLVSDHYRRVFRSLYCSCTVQQEQTRDTAGTQSTTT